jgi:hypothetical protein
MNSQRVAATSSTGLAEVLYAGFPWRRWRGYSRRPLAFIVEYPLQVEAPFPHAVATAVRVTSGTWYTRYVHPMILDLLRITRLGEVLEPLSRHGRGRGYKTGNGAESSQPRSAIVIFLISIILGFLTKITLFLF